MDSRGGFGFLPAHVKETRRSSLPAGVIKLSAPSNNKNALSHGLFARDLVLPWESEEDFMEHYQEIRAHYKPVGAPQEAFVCDIAQAFWMKRRLNIALQLSFSRHPDAPAMAEAGRDGWEGLGQYLHKKAGNTTRLSTEARLAAKASASSMVELAKLISDRILAASESASPQLPETQFNIESLKALLAQVRETNESVITVLKYAEQHDLQEGPFERAYRPEKLERDLKLAAMLDRQIEKAIQRLVNQKEYDRMYRQSGAEIELLPPPAGDVTLVPTAISARKDGVKLQKAPGAKKLDGG